LLIKAKKKPPVEGGFYACSCASLFKEHKRKKESYCIHIILFHASNFMLARALCQPFITMVKREIVLTS